MTNEVPEETTGIDRATSPVERAASVIGKLASYGRSQSLRSRVIKASAWTVAGTTASNVLRLGSNLVLARLLFPEAFGLMALVNTVNVGLNMFSDVGIGPSIIQNRRGDDPSFLNTAWTMQAIRGFFLFLVGLLLTYPLSLAYEEPQLRTLIPIVVCGAVFQGLRSTSFFTVNRQLHMRQLVTFELVTQSLTIAVTIILAVLYRSVIALAIGTLAGHALTSILSHVMLQRRRHRFMWDRDCARSLFRYGRWIFLGTILAFLSGQGATAIEALLVPFEVLGLIHVARVLSMAVRQVLGRIGERAVFPALSELHRDRPENIRSALFRVRLAMNSINMAVCLPLMVGAPWIIDVLYDDRYLDAGFFLSILAVACAIGLLPTEYNRLLLATGDSRSNTFLMAFRAAVQLAALVQGYVWFGVEGMLFGHVVSELANYLLVAVYARRLGVLTLKLDLTLIAIALGTFFAFVFFVLPLAAQGR